MCFSKKKGYCETFQTQRFQRNIFIKKKVIMKLCKPNDSIEICLLKKKVIVKLFKRKDSIEICLLKKRLL